MTYSPSDDQLKRAKAAVLYLIEKDPDVRKALKRLMNSPVRENEKIIPKDLCISRINTIPAYAYKGKPVSYFCQDVYEAFMEYGAATVRRSLIKHRILVKEGLMRKHPKKRTQVRCMVLDIGAID